MRCKYFRFRHISRDLEEDTGHVFAERDRDEPVAGEHVPDIPDRKDYCPARGVKRDRAGGDGRAGRVRVLVQQRHGLADKQQHPHVFGTDKIRFVPDPDMDITIAPGHDDAGRETGHSHPPVCPICSVSALKLETK